MTSATPWVDDTPGAMRPQYMGTGAQHRSQAGPATETSTRSYRASAGQSPRLSDPSFVHFGPCQSVSRTALRACCISLFVPATILLGMPELPRDCLYLLVCARTCAVPLMAMGVKRRQWAPDPTAATGTALSWRAPDVIIFHAVPRRRAVPRRAMAPSATAPTTWGCDGRAALSWRAPDTICYTAVPLMSFRSASFSDAISAINARPSPARRPSSRELMDLRPPARLLTPERGRYRGFHTLPPRVSGTVTNASSLSRAASHTGAAGGHAPRRHPQSGRGAKLSCSRPHHILCCAPESRPDCDGCI